MKGMKVMLMKMAISAWFNNKIASREQCSKGYTYYNWGFNLNGFLMYGLSLFIVPLLILSPLLEKEVYAELALAFGNVMLLFIILPYVILKLLSVTEFRWDRFDLGLRSNMITIVFCMILWYLSGFIMVLISGIYLELLPDKSAMIDSIVSTLTNLDKPVSIVYYFAIAVVGLKMFFLLLLSYSKSKEE